MGEHNGVDYTFQGWMGLDEDSVGKMEWGTFEPKPWEEADVDIKVTHCGMCGTDIHTLHSGWVSYAILRHTMPCLQTGIYNHLTRHTTGTYVVSCGRRA
jgi:hypothetical protein